MAWRPSGMEYLMISIVLNNTTTEDIHNLDGSMRHELPLPRRAPSVQDLDIPISPRRPLSSSFFASIDPLTPARHSSLNLYPQYIFPSKLNNLNNSLEIPYAFSHQRAAFYWTRDDALVNHKLNIWATPPCLNCELAGEDKARKCNRYQRQRDSLGQILCCTRCECTGEMLSCVEQVEIRADGRYGHTEVKDWGEIIVFDQWRKEERALRDIGLVWWTPINPEYGDIDRKRMIIEQWKQRDRPQPTLPVPDIDSNETLWDKGQAAEQELVEKMRICQQMNQELVAEWDEEYLNLEPRLLARQAEEETMKARKLAEGNNSKSTLDQEYITELEKDQNYWSYRIRTRRDEQYDEEVATVGRDVANSFQEVWKTMEGDVILQACSFLERKQYRMRSGATEEDAIALSKAELSAGVVNNLEDLVPRIFQPVV